MAEAFDIAVIGGGPGGYVAAIRAAQLGMKTVVIEREHLGGICLNWGCIPTKALLRTAEVLTLVRHAEEFGLKANGVTFDLAKVIGRSRQVAGKLSSGVAYLLKKHKVAVIDGTARLKAKGVIAVKGGDGKALADVEAKHIIIATGARARSLPGLEPDGKLDLDLQGSDDPGHHAEIAACRRFGRHRHRVRELLQCARRESDRGRDHGPHPARGGRRGFGLREDVLREAGHDDPHGREGRQA